ncbi:hypothetical protein CIB48_g6127 [Xylaria polymorpha]|nr:hypothetical protein CIB48_g6127 [Xylaria polymorpha]
MHDMAALPSKPHEVGLNMQMGCNELHERSQSQPQTNSPTGDQYNNKNPMIHTVALGVTPLALLALFLPPRRLDLRAMMLGGVATWGTNQLAHDYTEKSFVQRFSSRMASLMGTELPEKAKATQTRLREEKERREKLRALREDMIRSGAAPPKGEGLEGWTEDQKRALLTAYERQRREEQQHGLRVDVGKEKGILEKLWMGDAAPDWKEKRDQREKERCRRAAVDIGASLRIRLLRSGVGSRTRGIPRRGRRVRIRASHEGVDFSASVEAIRDHVPAALSRVRSLAGPSSV